MAARVLPYNPAALSAMAVAWVLFISTAEDIAADVIIMVTEGRNGFLDALRGSTTEQVLRGAKCPVMAVPEL